jgi:hypothetical protein
MHRERVDLRRAERHHAGDEVGPAARQHLREGAAAALADDRGALALLGDEAFQAPLEARQQHARAVDVGHDPGSAGPVPRALQPAGHHRERSVARHEARNQQHRAAAAVRHAVAAEDRIPQQRSGLEADSGLAPQRRPITQRNEARSSHRDLLTLIVGWDGSRYSRVTRRQ